MTPPASHRCGSTASFRHFWRNSARLRSRRNPAEDRPEGQEGASLAEPNATRLSRSPLESAKMGSTKGFTTDIKLVAKLLGVKTQA
jgi:hypothetical protein